MDLYSVSSAYTRFRITGMVSGLDTDQIVSDLMKIDRMPLDKLYRKKQLAEWKRDEYRNIINLLRSMKDEFFDVLKPSSYALSAAYYKKMNVTSTDSSVVTARGDVNALAGSHSIIVNKLAKAASIESSGPITAQIEGSVLSDINIESIKGKSFSLEIDGVRKTITISSSINSAEELLDDLQYKIESAFGSGKIIVTDSTGDGTGRLVILPKAGSGITKVRVYSGPNESFDAYSHLGFHLFNNSNRLNIYESLETISSKLNVQFDANGKLNLTINGRSFSFDKSTTLASMMNTINNDSAAGVRMEYNELTDTIKFTAKQTGAGNNLTISETGSTFLAAIGLQSARGTGAANYNLTKTKLNVNIDGVTKEIELSTGLGSHAELAAELESKIEEAFAGVNVSVAVDADNRLLVVLEPGSGHTVSFGHADNIEESALSELGLSEGFVKGSDASVIIDGHSLTRSSNTFTVDGITYTLHGESPLKAGGAPGERVAATISASLDVDGIFENIKKFVEKYNEVIDKINAKLSEKYDRNFYPLTQEEKEQLTEDEVKKWEEKAKTGLLRNDSILQNIVYNLRIALFEKVEGVSLGLTDIGITTGTYSEKGKLKIDEARLREAIANNPDEVANLFAKKSSIDLTADMPSDKRMERYREEGLAFRIFDILEDNIRTVGGKGILLQKAGMPGDRTEFDNMLYHEIDEYEDRMYELQRKLYERETEYYNRFAAMERVLAQMTAQSNWLLAQFSNNSGGW